MKAAKLITTALLATLALAACNKEDDAPESSQVDIRTTICASKDIASADIGTRANIVPDGSGTFSSGDELGLYAYADSRACLTNSSYKVGTTTLFWDELSTTEAITFSAYYPKMADIADATAYTFNVATAITPDLLVATPVTASEGETVALDFHHAMHRLRVQVTTNVPDWDAATARITLMGMNTTTSVNILTGITTLGEASKTDGDYASQTGASTTFIVAPQKVTTGADWIQIELGGKIFTYQVPAQYTKPGSGGTETLSQLNSGETLTLTLNVNREGVTLMSGNISAWGTQGTIDDAIDVSSGTDAPVATVDELIAAITNATGTEDNPTKITLAADMTLPIGMSPLGTAVSITISAKHIEIDGGGHSLFPPKSANAFMIDGNASLKLSNVTIDGEDAERVGSIIVIPSNNGGKLTLGKGFKLTRAKIEPSSYSEYVPYGIEAYDGTLVIEDGAEISGCGNGCAIQVTNDCLLRLKGGNVSGNSGYGIKLQSGFQPIDIRIENTLSANTRFENIMLSSNYTYGEDVRPGFETIITAAPGCALIATDLVKFMLKPMTDATDDFELYLEDNAIKLRKKG